MAKEIHLKQLKHYWPLYGFILPSAFLVALFAYFPAISGFYHAFFRWNGDYINNFISGQNFTKALGSPWMWIVAALWTVGLLTFAKDKKKKRRRLTVLVTSCVPPILGLVMAWQNDGVFIDAGSPFLQLGMWGGLWLAFFFFGDKEGENRNVVLTLIAILTIAMTLSACCFTSFAAWSIALLLSAVFLWLVPLCQRWPRLTDLKLIQAFAGIALLFWMLGSFAGGDKKLWSGFSIITILVVANLFKMIPSIAAAVVIHRLKSERANYWYRVLFVIPMIIPGMVALLIWKFFFEPDSVFNLVLHKTGIMWLLVKLDAMLGWGGIFQEGINPVWLGNPDLVLPAFILWGFPWVGVVGVLIYLAGLQSIDTSVYEAADLDGVGAFGKFRHIEFPLIMTQVRINLVLMIIGTFQMYGFILILFGDSGGPNGVMMVPDLYMFRNAFREGYAGYACALGLIMFFFILVLTEINNRFVRVDK